jgi:hypothetical protein
MLAAAMDPFLCGYYNHPEIPCTCGPGHLTMIDYDYYINYYSVSGHLSMAF